MAEPDDHEDEHEDDPDGGGDGGGLDEEKVESIVKRVVGELLGDRDAGDKDGKKDGKPGEEDKGGARPRTVAATEDDMEAKVRKVTAKLKQEDEDRDTLQKLKEKVLVEQPPEKRRVSTRMMGWK